MIGIDLVQISRIEKAVSRGSFLENTFTCNEIEYYVRHNKRIEVLAGFYAAKEALVKASGAGLNHLRLREIETLHTDTGQPYYSLYGLTLEQFAGFALSLTITHEDDYALAAALVLPADGSRRLRSEAEDRYREAVRNSLEGIYPRLIPSAALNAGKHIVLPLRKANGHKGTYGKVGLIAGSAEMPGAALLAAESAAACLRSGAGLVTLYVPECLRVPFQMRVKEAMLSFFAEEAGKIIFDPDRLQQIMMRSDSIVIGNGMGQSVHLQKVIRYLAQHFEGVLIVDGDGLHAAARDPDILLNHKCRLILTPHVLEFGRLFESVFGKKPDAFLSDALPENSVAVARSEGYDSVLDRDGASVQALSRRLDAVIVRKSNISVISDGRQVFFNTTGTPAMAKGGSGDVLAGMVGALSVRLPPLDALLYACYHFGRLGELAAKATGEESLLASDIILEIN